MCCLYKVVSISFNFVARISYSIHLLLFESIVCESSLAFSKVASYMNMAEKCALAIPIKWMTITQATGYVG